MDTICARRLRGLAAVKAFLSEIGEDVSREGLRDTPERVVKAWLDMTSGYGADSCRAFGRALFHEPVLKGAQNPGIICVRDIAFASISTVDLLPFRGRCHIIYSPANGTVVGLSKLARLVRLMSKRILSQQDLTWSVARALHRHAAPEGLAVFMEATHLAGRPETSESVTWACMGTFENNTETIMELELVMSLNGITWPQHPPCTTTTSTGFFSWDGDKLAVETTEQNHSMATKRSALAAPMYELLVRCCQVPHSQELAQGVNNYAAYILCATSGYSKPLPVPHQYGSAAEDTKACCRQDTPCTSTTSLSDCTAQELPEVQQLKSPWGAQRTSGDEPVWRHGLPLEQPGGESDPYCYDSDMGDMESAPSEAESERWPFGQGHWLLNSAPSRCVEGVFHFQSTCEHHLLPFYGDLFMAYIPGPTGLRFTYVQLGEIVEVFTRRLQLQEKIMHQVADALQMLLEPSGVLVACRAVHMCMVARGVESHSSSTVTTVCQGKVERGMMEAAQRALQAGMR